VVEGQGIEFMYQLYNPTLLKIEVLRLEKRLDDELYYLRYRFSVAFDNIGYRLVLVGKSDLYGVEVAGSTCSSIFFCNTQILAERPGLGKLRTGRIFPQWLKMRWSIVIDQA
jgi:hypothetical protein